MTSYRSLPQDDGTYSVEVTESGRSWLVPGFGSDIAAAAWIRKQERMAEVAERWERNAPRNWRD
jgi:hypothetical protein